MDLECTVWPAKTAHTHTVVFLHGRGDRAITFALSLQCWRGSAGKSLAELFPSTKWVFPSAGLRPAVALGARPQSQWFDQFSSRDFGLNPEVQVPGLRESVPAVRKVLRREAEELGGRWDRIVLAGISQGAATAVHALLHLAIPDACRGSPRLAALLAFSCQLPFIGLPRDETLAALQLGEVPAGDEAVRGTPVLLEHCANDDVVPVEQLRLLTTTLTGFGASVIAKEYPDGGHW